MSGAENLIPQFKKNTTQIETFTRDGFTITRFRPRTEGLFARIERWVDANGDTQWRAITKENITSIYGRTKEARIFAPDNEKHVYEWLIQETFDAKGNHILYEYAKDNQNLSFNKIYEENRRYCRLYIRRIYYGNSNEPVGPKRAGTNHKDQISGVNRNYLFEVVFDYGDLKQPPEDPYVNPSDEQEPTTNWPIRPDPFSIFRSGFEIRTLRRCERVLMFHHFKELGGPTLVRSTDFEYRKYENNESNLISFLNSVAVKGYRKDGDEYKSASVPSVSFKYSEFKPQEQHYQSVTARGNDMPPNAFNDPNFTLVDIFGDGLPDVLHTSPAGFRYWKNLGNGVLDSPRFMNSVPAGVMLSTPGVAFGDMGGDGRADLLVLSGSVKGFFEMTPDGGWESFKRFNTFPSFDLSNPNIRMADLTGDGLTDVLMTADRRFLWFECLGEEGYAEPNVIERIYDLNEFPDVYFNDTSGRVRLADMSGDGLNDIVLLHNGRIDYWSNLGYGKFGKRITMSNSPKLERNFDPKRLFLVDLDGSGCADLVYVDFDKVHFWFNQSGNSWSDQQVIHGTPVVTDVDSIQFADFYGTGTSALVWSYDYNRYPGGNIKVLDFSGGVKPYLLTEMSNNMGATTCVRYAPSTKLFLDSEQNGGKWATKLPFPVQVVEKVETIDHVSKTKLVTSYKYHHGYFDGREREFRGFGRVDRIDTEIFEAFSEPDLHDSDLLFNNNQKGFHVPPVLTKSWFHTGAYFDGKELMERYREEFYKGDNKAFKLDDHDVERGSTPHDAYRAFRGSNLRTEIYALDGTEKAEHPYLVTENIYQVKQLQPKGGNAYAVYLTTSLERLAYHYERNARDPRIAHNMTLNIDDSGNVTDSVSIAYPRREPKFPEQEEIKIIYNKTDFINKATEEDFYYSGVEYQKRTYEVMGIEWSWNMLQLLKIEDFDSVITNPNVFKEYRWQRPENHTEIEKRIVKWLRTYFRKDENPEQLDPVGNLEQRLQLGEIESLGVPYESYQTAFTDELVEEVYPFDITHALLKKGGYHSELDAPGYWWIPSGRQAFKVNGFLQPFMSQDPFGNRSTISYDKYCLLTESTKDALQNEIKATNDYYVLQPQKIEDPNGNSSEVAFDILGVVVGTAISGRNSEGDNLNGFITDPTEDQISDSLNLSNSLLGNATTRIIYNLRSFQTKGEPNFVHTISREVHTSELEGNTTPLQNTFLYSDGFGRQIQTKIQAGPIFGDGARIEKRWIGTGWIIFNNKGKPIKKYEPFFSNTSKFDFALMRGVSPTFFYDPLERVVTTLFSNHTYEKVVFDPWKQTTFDANDSISVKDPKTDPDVGAFFKELDDSIYLPTWYTSRKDGGLGGEEKDAARKAIKHAETPNVSHLDTLGRPFLTVANNGKDENGNQRLLETRVKLDIEGNDLEITDPRGVESFKHGFDMVGRKVSVDSKDAGISVILADVLSNPIHNYDANGNFLSIVYDELRRPVEFWVMTENGQEFLAEKTIYGESLTNSEVGNHRGRVYKVYDGAGITENVEYDFKGNLKESRRQLLLNPTVQVRWSASGSSDFDETFAESLLNANETYIAKMKFDALNRIVENTAPDGSVYISEYNEANLLESLRVRLKENGGTREVQFIINVDYNEKGQRVKIKYGNAVVTEYTYEPETFRLKNLFTKKANGKILQNLSYTYDPMGNIVQIKDDAVNTIYHNQQEVNGISNFEYDPIYRLITVTGREHQAIGAAHYKKGNTSKQSEYLPIPPPPPTTDSQALQMYTETYQYDPSGNLLEIKHRRGTSSDSPVIWTRTQQYETNNNRFPISNRIISSGADSNDPGKRDQLFTFEHDANGNITKMPHLQQIRWDYKNQMIETDLNLNGNKVYYSYAAGGQRFRKVVYKGSVREERIYLGGYEIYRKYKNNNIVFERQTLHVMDEKRRICLVETRTKDTENTETGQPKICIRYQLDNHLGSSILEVDETRDANIISVEEYYPYGGTSYIGGKDQREVSRKRYRYSGKERDDETGLYYYGVRYYAPWLCRWMSPDPSGAVDGFNIYQFNLSSPVLFNDQSGTNSELAVPESNFIIEFDHYKAQNLGGDKTNPKNLGFLLKDENSRKSDNPWPGGKTPPQRQPVSLSKALDAGDREFHKAVSEMLGGRRFAEVDELDQLWRRALTDSKGNTRSYSNAQREFRKLIATDNSKEAQAVRKAFDHAGVEIKPKGKSFQFRLNSDSYMRPKSGNNMSMSQLRKSVDNVKRGRGAITGGILGVLSLNPIQLFTDGPNSPINNLEVIGATALGKLHELEQGKLYADPVSGLYFEIAYSNPIYDVKGEVVGGDYGVIYYREYGRDKEQGKWVGVEKVGSEVIPFKPLPKVY
jgi:RHS repeat-associated protein